MSKSALPCPRCEIGMLHPGHATYVRTIQGTLISVPDMLVWTCDLCRYQEFDEENVARVEALLHEAAPTPRPASRLQSLDSADGPTGPSLKPT
jgi:hypothetical protein